MNGNRRQTRTQWFDTEFTCLEIDVPPTIPNTFAGFRGRGQYSRGLLPVVREGLVATKHSEVRPLM